MTKREDSDSGSDDGDVAFASVDFSGVDFDAAAAELSPVDKIALSVERDIAFGRFSCLKELNKEDEEFAGISELGEYLASGRYAEALKGKSASKFLDHLKEQELDEGISKKTVANIIRSAIFSEVNSIADCIEVEFLGIAALNLFLQLNYTGPSLERNIAKQIGETVQEDPLVGINPHPCFADHLLGNEIENIVRDSSDGEEKKQSITTSSYRHTKFHNAVLSELAVEGEWPCQVCEAPYFLLLARSILLPLANPTRSNWMAAKENLGENITPVPMQFESLSSKLTGAKLWAGRAAVAHARLLQCKELPETLWKEVEETFKSCIEIFCDDKLLAPNEDSNEDDLWTRRKDAAVVMLEWGLAQHHFDRPGMGRKAFVEAKEFTGLVVSITGASGVRTKFQTKKTAQYLVEASSEAKHNEKEAPKQSKELIESQKVDHAEDEILLERIKFEDESKNEIKDLSVLDQAILLALCLDVKNSNPTGDELTAEEMGAYLARVLDHHDDWMLYSTALLERAWLVS